MQEDVAKHLELLQGPITRMAGNSFLLKGWTVTLSAALFALAAQDTRPIFSLIALLPTLSFWGLDAYYLRQERLFRKLYDRLRRGPEEGPSDVEPFSMDTRGVEHSVDSWAKTLLAPAIVWLHAVVFACVLIVSLSLCLVEQSPK